VREIRGGSVLTSSLIGSSSSFIVRSPLEETSFEAAITKGTDSRQGTQSETSKIRSGCNYPPRFDQRERDPENNFNI